MRSDRSRLRRAAAAVCTRRVAVRLVVAAAATVFLVRPLLPRIGNAADQLRQLDPSLTLAGFALQVAALLCYSRLTQVALDEERRRIGFGRLFRIQLVTRAVSSTVPAGAAAGPTVGFRLITSAGVSSTAASTALASGSVLSAFVLNVILWGALVVSVPLHGFHAIYAATALFGILVMLVVAGVFVAIVDGSAIVERPVRRLATRLHIDPDQATGSIRRFGEQIEELLANRSLVGRLGAWAAANWLLDALSLWVFLHMFDVRVGPVGVLVAFGIANVLAALPLTPGGVGIVEWAYLTILVLFGAGVDEVTIAVTSYRVAQFLFPIGLGALSSASLAIEAGRRRRGALAADPV